MAPEKEHDSKVHRPSLRIVGSEDSGGTAPQISLEHILELRKVEHRALMIKKEIERQYVSAIEAMIEARIKEKAEKAYSSGKKTSQGKRRVRVEFSRRFFMGEHRCMAKKAFESVKYPEDIGAVRQYKENIYLLYRKMQNVSGTAKELSDYLNRIKERKDLEKKQKKPKNKPHPAGDEKMYFSEAEESRIHNYTMEIFSALEEYNRAAAEFTSSLPDLADAEKDPLFDEQRIADANTALEQIRSAPYDESLVQVVSSAAKALREAARCIDGISTMAGMHLDFNTHLMWGSMNFGSYLAKRGFRVTEKKYTNTTRAICAVGEVEIPEKPNPRP